MQFESRGERRSETLYLTESDAIALISAAERQGIRVLGVDCVELTREATRPLLDGIADYSTTLAAWGQAVEFVRAQASRGLRFEVVLEG